MSTKLTADEVKVAALIQQVRAAPKIKTAWLPASYVMAHVEVESDFVADVKASDYAKTGSEGLMQVTKATAAEVLNQYAGLITDSGLKTMAEQTDPLTSLLTGMLYLYTCHQSLVPVFGNPLAYAHIAVAYNAGPGNSKHKTLGQAASFPYYIKWKSAQQRFAFLDAPEPMIHA